jgi:two-component system, chemotaxis family, CheB/CheR fusion protein
MTEPTNDDFESLLHFLRDVRGFDFTGYKRSTLVRRVSKRMEMLGIDSYSAYVDHLQVDPDEFTHLFNFILINVTSFFRDPPIWEYVQQEVITRILQSKDAADQIRVWDVGCASGEETYTIAMLLAEALGRDGFSDRVKIYATDVDLEALEQARQGTYTRKQVDAVPGTMGDRYFADGVNGGLSFDKELRRSVVFGRHDLVKDAPISRIDLLVCRNTLMYFNADVQARILANFRFALNPTGFLLLGKSEMLFTRVKSFTPVDMKRRVFRAVDGVGEATVPQVQPLDLNEPDETAQQGAAFESSPVAQLLLGADGRLAQANAQARSDLPIGKTDVGRPLQDLEISYRPVELRSMIEAAHDQREIQEANGVEWHRGGKTRRYDIQVVPLLARDGSVLGTTVSFADVTQVTRLEEELETSRQELETALEELQSTNEELETTNEELQSTNEELETTNEELQSTNEELETMNEELQSTNEELETVNEEARQQTDELNHLNVFTESVLSNLERGLAVVDTELRVEVWNQQAEELWGLHGKEVQGQPLMSLDIGLPVLELKGLLSAALDGSKGSIDLEAVTRRGRTITCQVSCAPLTTARGEVAGVIVLMEER